MSTVRFHPALRVVAAAEQASEHGHVLEFRRPHRVLEVPRPRGAGTRMEGRCWSCTRKLINGLCPKCSRPAA